MTSLTAEHQAFIDDIQTITDEAQQKLIADFIKQFDLETILSEGIDQSLVDDFFEGLKKYILEGIAVGNKFADQKKEIFNASNSI